MPTANAIKLSFCNKLECFCKAALSNSLTFVGTSKRAYQQLYLLWYVTKKTKLLLKMLIVVKTLLLTTQNCKLDKTFCDGHPGQLWARRLRMLFGILSKNELKKIKKENKSARPFRQLAILSNDI
jgi:hypothetical protein